MKSILTAYIVFNVCLHVSSYELNKEKYCQIDCGNGKGQHTACLYEIKGKACTEFDNQGLQSQQIKDNILNQHNEFRLKVALGKQTGQPPASDMMTLEWDDELMAIAEIWSMQCLNFAHDTCRMTLDGEIIGQNIGQFIETPKHQTSVYMIVDGWFDEVNDFADINHADPESFMSIGHYSQMLWGSTRKIGCGSLIREFNESSKYSRNFLVCNYKPAGNIMTKPMYRKGKACESCPGNCSVKYPGLCDALPPDTTEESVDYQTISSGTIIEIITALHMLCALLVQKIT